MDAHCCQARTWSPNKDLLHPVYVLTRKGVKTTHERCGPFSLVVLSQRRGRVTTSSGPTLSETLSSKTLQVSQRLNSAKTQVRSRTKESKLTLHAVVVFWLKQTKQRNTKSALPQYHHKRELHLENLNFTPLLVVRLNFLRFKLLTMANLSSKPIY